VGFPWARHGQQVSTLSGGERSRLLFVGLTLARYSLLMLDEPTNHLDMEGKEALADTLQQFGGVLLVSHDRQLISQSCNRFWLIEDGKLSNGTMPTPCSSVCVKARADATGRYCGLPRDEAAAQYDDVLEKLVALETLLADYWQAEASKAAVAGAMA
jgi:ATPase subunit of ABC transporter with duplicated ATPase domains